MKTETINRPHPEQDTRLEVNQAFDSAHKALYGVVTDPRLTARLIDKGIDPYDDTGKPTYWREVGSYVHQRTEGARSAGHVSLALDTLKLMTATPAYLLSQHELELQEQGRNMLTKDETNAARQANSEFNGLLRQYASDHREVRPSDISRGLLGIVTQTIEDKGARQNSAKLLKTAVRGAQHEIAFGQVLEKTGREYQPADLDGDLVGTDYFVQGDHGNILRVDIKASDMKFSNLPGANGVFAIDRNTIKIRSFVTDREIGDNFFMPDDLAEQRAPKLNEMLTGAEKQLNGASVLTAIN